MFYPPSGYLLLVCYLLVIYFCTISFRIIHTNQRLMFYGYLFRTVLNVITEFTLNTTRRIYSKHYLMLSKLSGYQYLMFQVNKILPHEYILSKSLLKKTSVIIFTLKFKLEKLQMRLSQMQMQKNAS